MKLHMYTSTSAMSHFGSSWTKVHIFTQFTQHSKICIWRMRHFPPFSLNFGVYHADIGFHRIHFWSMAISLIRTSSRVWMYPLTITDRTYLQHWTRATRSRRIMYASGVRVTWSNGFFLLSISTFLHQNKQTSNAWRNSWKVHTYFIRM